MDVIEFVKGMVPGLKRADVDEDLATTLKELNKSVVPAYQDADTLFRSIRIQSPEAKELQETFYDYFKPKGGKRSTFINDIFEVLPNVIQNAEHIRKEVNRQFEPDLVSDGMTAKKAAVLRAAEYFTFISRFSLDLLSYVYCMEAQHNTGDKEAVEVTPLIIKRVNAHMGRYTRLLQTYGAPNSDFSRMISSSPDVLIGGKQAELAASVYPIEKLDTSFVQVGAGFIPNPIYHVRMLVAEWQSSRFKQSEETLAMLKLRVLHLQMLNRNERSPKLEEQIGYTQSRVDKLERSLNEQREDVGLPAMGA